MNNLDKTYEWISWETSTHYCISQWDGVSAIKNKWINPSDEKAPGGGSEHIADTPEKDLQNPAAQKNELDKKASKHDKRDPSNLNSTLGKNKHRRKRKS